MTTATKRQPRLSRSPRLAGSASLGAPGALHPVAMALLYVVAAISSLTMVVPFLWMLSASLKDDVDVFNFPIEWIPKTIHWENYAYIWEKANYPALFGNTAKLLVLITVLQVLTSSLAAYAFSKIDFPERKKLFLAYLGTLMVPFQVYMIPQFMIVKHLGLSDTHMALVLIQAFSPMGVFLIKQHYDTIPKELSEAARIDGLNELGIYSRIVLPLSKPAVASLVIFTSVAVWNDFLAPLIYLNSPKRYTIQLGLRNMISEYTAEYAAIMAASVLSLIPILIVFLVCQRFFIEGVTAGGVKG